MKRHLFALTAVLLAGCSDDAAEPQPRAARASLSPGQYEARWTVNSLRSSDNSTPATALAEGATGTATGCVGPDGQIDPALFAEDGDQCTVSDSFVRAGRISMQLECSRSGQPGQILQSVTGTTTAKSLEGEISTSTYLSGIGDYQMVRSVNGRRIGECPAPAKPATAA